jgi:hypothetical protein
MRHLLYAALILGFAACASAQVSPPNPPFVITITPESPNVTVKNGVFVKLTVKNLTNLPMDISANISDLTGVDPNYIWHVLDDRGALVPKKKYAHPELAGGWPFLNAMLEPGATFTRTEPLSRLFDMSKPAKYVIEASRLISFSDKNAGVVRSNVITVTVSAGEQ